MKGYSVHWPILGAYLLWLMGAAYLLSVLGCRIFGRIGRFRTVLERFTFSGKRWTAAAFFLVALGVFLTAVLSAPMRNEEALSVNGRLRLGKENFFGRMDVKRDRIQMTENGLIRSHPVNLSAGAYRLTVTASGNRVLGETARLQVYLDRLLIADYNVDTTFSSRTFSFHLSGCKTARMRLLYLNDYYNLLEKLDRNVQIEEMIVEKVSSERDTPPES
ncbi:MAG: carbohydrate-binding domain-containing protein [Acidobacteriota bacterium]